MKIWDKILVYLGSGSIDSVIIIACFFIILLLVLLWAFKNYEFQMPPEISWPPKLLLKRKEKAIEINDLNRKIEKMQGEIGRLLELTDNILRHHVNNQIFQKEDVDFGLNIWSNISLQGATPKEKEFPYLLYVIIDKDTIDGKTINPIKPGENICLLLRTSCKVKDIVIVAKSVCGDVRLRVSPIAEYFFYTKIQFPDDAIEGKHKISFSMVDALTENVWEKQYIDIPVAV